MASQRFFEIVHLECEVRYSSDDLRDLTGGIESHPLNPVRTRLKTYNMDSQGLDVPLVAAGRTVRNAEMMISPSESCDCRRRIVRTPRHTREIFTGLFWRLLVRFDHNIARSSGCRAFEWHGPRASQVNTEHLTAATDIGVCYLSRGGSGFALPGRLYVTLPFSSRKSRRGIPAASTIMLMRAFPLASYKVTLASRSLFLPTKIRVGEKFASFRLLRAACFSGPSAIFLMASPRVTNSDWGVSGRSQTFSPTSRVPE